MVLDCRNFAEHQWKKNTCRNCARAKASHVVQRARATRSVLERHPSLQCLPTVQDKTKVFVSARRSSPTLRSGHCDGFQQHAWIPSICRLCKRPPSMHAAGKDRSPQQQQRMRKRSPVLAKLQQRVRDRSPVLAKLQMKKEPTSTMRQQITQVQQTHSRPRSPQRPPPRPASRVCPPPHTRAAHLLQASAAVRRVPSPPPPLEPPLTPMPWMNALEPPATPHLAVTSKHRRAAGQTIQARTSHSPSPLRLACQSRSQPSSRGTSPTTPQRASTGVKPRSKSPTCRTRASPARREGTAAVAGVGARRAAQIGKVQSFWEQQAQQHATEQRQPRDHTQDMRPEDMEGAHPEDLDDALRDPTQQMRARKAKNASELVREAKANGVFFETLPSSPSACARPSTDPTNGIKIFSPIVRSKHSPSSGKSVLNSDIQTVSPQAGGSKACDHYTPHRWRQAVCLTCRLPRTAHTARSSPPRHGQPSSPVRISPGSHGSPVKRDQTRAQETSRRPAPVEWHGGATCASYTSKRPGRVIVTKHDFSISCASDVAATQPAPKVARGVVSRRQRDLQRQILQQAREFEVQQRELERVQQAKRAMETVEREQAQERVAAVECARREAEKWKRGKQQQEAAEKLKRDQQRQAEEERDRQRHEEAKKQRKVELERMRERREWEDAKQRDMERQESLRLQREREKQDIVRAENLRLQREAEIRLEAREAEILLKAREREKARLQQESSRLEAERQEQQALVSRQEEMERQRRFEREQEMKQERIKKAKAREIANTREIERLKMVKQREQAQLLRRQQLEQEELREWEMLRQREMQREAKDREAETHARVVQEQRLRQEKKEQRARRGRLRQEQAPRARKNMGQREQKDADQDDGQRQFLERWQAHQRQQEERRKKRDSSTQDRQQELLQTEQTRQLEHRRQLSEENAQRSRVQAEASQLQHRERERHLELQAREEARVKEREERELTSNAQQRQQSEQEERARAENDDRDRLARGRLEAATYEREQRQKEESEARLQRHTKQLRAPEQEARPPQHECAAFRPHAWRPGKCQDCGRAQQQHAEQYPPQAHAQPTKPTKGGRRQTSRIAALAGVVNLNGLAGKPNPNRKAAPKADPVPEMCHARRPRVVGKRRPQQRKFQPLPTTTMQPITLSAKVGATRKHNQHLSSWQDNEENRVPNY